MVKMKNQLVAQTVAPAAGEVIAAPGRNPRMQMGMRWEQAPGPGGNCSWSRTADTIHVASSACSRSFNDLRRERAKTKPRALPARSFSRKRLKGGGRHLQQGLSAAPITSRAGLLPALLPGPFRASAVQRHQPGWARSWEPLEAGEGRVPAHPGPWKGCQQPAVSGSAGPGEERSIAERQAVGAALCSHRALLCCLLGCRPARRAACSFHKTKQGKKMGV